MPNVKRPSRQRSLLRIVQIYTEETPKNLRFPRSGFPREKLAASFNMRRHEDKRLPVPKKIRARRSTQKRRRPLYACTSARIFARRSACKYVHRVCTLARNCERAYGRAV